MGHLVLPKNNVDSLVPVRAKRQLLRQEVLGARRGMRLPVGVQGVTKARGVVDLCSVCVEPQSRLGVGPEVGQSMSEAQHGTG